MSCEVHPRASFLSGDVLRTFETYQNLRPTSPTPVSSKQTIGLALTLYLSLNSIIKLVSTRLLATLTVVEPTGRPFENRTHRRHHIPNTTTVVYNLKVGGSTEEEVTH